MSNIFQYHLSLHFDNFQQRLEFRRLPTAEQIKQHALSTCHMRAGLRHSAQGCLAIDRSLARYPVSQQKDLVARGQWVSALTPFLAGRGRSAGCRHAPRSRTKRPAFALGAFSGSPRRPGRTSKRWSFPSSERCCPGRPLSPIRFFLALSRTARSPPAGP